MHGFLQEMGKCCIFRCAEKMWRGCRESKQSLNPTWSSVLAYVWHNIIMNHLLHSSYAFFFFHSDLPSTHSRPVESDRSINIVFVRPSVRPSVHPSVRLIRVFAVCIKQHWFLSYPLSAQQRLIRLGGCPDWSESSLGAQVVLLILSCCG